MAHGVAGSRSHLVIHGLVQGVSFRAYAREEARKLELTGWVKNLTNGDVEAVAEGDPKSLAAFADWCQKGPPEARVVSVKVDSAPATGEFQSFAIVR
jgi:acylphosphatase